MVPFLPGFAQICGAKNIPEAAQKIDGVSVDDVEKGDMEKQASVATGAEINKS